MTRKPFHSSDFTASEGPGMAKLREAKARGVVEIKAPIKLTRKGGLELIRFHMRNGDWKEAILEAGKFPDLGEHAEAIQRGREAIQRPAFQRQLKRNPEALIEAAKQALLERWPL